MSTPEETARDDALGEDREDDWDDLDAREPVRAPLRGPVAAPPGGPCPAPVPAPRAAAPARLRFQEVALTVTVPPGTTAGLGRDPEWAPGTAAALAGHRTVSGRHARVAVAADGTATVTEEPPGAVNGTRLNGTDLVPGRPYPLTDGDLLRLGSRISCVVTLGRPLDGPPG